MSKETKRREHSLCYLAVHYLLGPLSSIAHRQNVLSPRVYVQYKQLAQIPAIKQIFEKR